MGDSNDEFVIDSLGARAKGILESNGFIVRAGSIARREVAQSGAKVSPIRSKLLAEGVLVEDGDGLRFIKDHLFGSPSGAAAAVLGTSVNGWTAWKKNDATLAQIKRIARINPTALLLSEAQRLQIIQTSKHLLEQGKTPTDSRLEEQYQAFRSRFGPAVLAGLDGEPLLNLMHETGNRDSLAYWLEFKNDEEFETRQFGSIAGGSALKFRVFRRKETGNWQAAGPNANQPIDISIEQAIEIARTHRDQLLKGAELLKALPENASDEDYAQLQDDLDEQALEVSRLAWGHKYFSLIFPDKLDDFHSPVWQRFILLKLLQLPPEGEGRYVCAGRFVAAAKEVGMPITRLDGVLNAIHGSRHRYWRIGTTSGSNSTSYWKMMRDRSRIAVGWSKVGDISWVDGKKESTDKLKSILTEVNPNAPQHIGRDASQLAQFVVGISEGDIVVAAEGMKILGLGRVIGGYEFHEEFEFPHQRKVEWITDDEWQMPVPREGLLSTVRELNKFSENLLAIEQRIQSAPGKGADGGKESSPAKPVRLTGTPGHIQSILERKGQVILYGPPGTGKTYWAERTANELASIATFQKSFDVLDQGEREAITGNAEQLGLVRFCCFHPAYGYEDFLEGYRPQSINGQVSFELRDGVFKKLCKDAEASPNRQFYLIVDEINRGDIPRICGELLTVLEQDKRGKRIILPLSQEAFSVPRNVFVIGTMNTADRSISLLDAALRRRFGFVELMPDGAVLKDSTIGGIALRAWFDALNARIREHVGRDARNLQIGHSYFMHAGNPLRDFASFKRAFRDDIIPLLEEYCYEDYGTLENILGGQLIDASAQRIRHDLFDDGQDDALIQALLTPFAEITTSSEAISSDESQTPLDQDDEAIEP